MILEISNVLEETDADSVDQLGDDFFDALSLVSTICKKSTKGLSAEHKHNRVSNRDFPNLEIEMDIRLPPLIVDNYQEEIIPRFSGVSVQQKPEKVDLDDYRDCHSIEVEGPSLGHLLLREYPNKQISPECKSRTLEFIANHESVSDRDIEFVKVLTKAAYKIHKSNPQSLVGLEERVYNFNLEGIEIINLGRPKGYSRYRIINLKSHFYSHGGYFAKAIFDALNENQDTPFMKKISWAIEWYRLYTFAAIISEDSDPKHCAHCYSWAADGARTVFYAINKREEIPEIEKINWARKWGEARRLSADQSMEFDQEHAAQSYRKAAEARRILFYKTGEINYAIGAIDYYGRFHDFYRKNPDRITPKIEKLMERCKSDLYTLKRALKIPA